MRPRNECPDLTRAHACASRCRGVIALAALPLAMLGHAPASAQAPAASTCGPVALAGGYGPYDYRTDRDKLGIVERPHFPPAVEALIGTKRAPVGADIDYTLKAFPNHHRALIAAMRYGEKSKSPHPQFMSYPVECYFDRALRFRPDDTIVRMIYAQFLARNNRAPEALGQLGMAQAKAGDNAFTHYNLGMLYVDLKDYDKGLQQAHEALRLGFPRPELRERLAAVGKWREADAPKPPAAASAGAAGEARPAVDAASDAASDAAKN